MIKNISQLLEEIKTHGVEEISQYLNIQHNPTIGAMYEGLTKELAEKSIFNGMDLKVVSGKITNSIDHQFSNQIDCMIVIGDGKKMPYTEEFIYDIDQVIMVIEVKKNLFGKELCSGYNNLLSVANIQRNTRNLRVNAIEDAFRSIVRKPLPDFDDVEDLDEKDQMLYHTLIIEALLPIRVIFGYDGFKSEESLRKGFIEYLSANVSTKDEIKRGFGASSFPNLIVAGNNAIIKTNGMPYAISFENTDEYCWMASYRENPFILFLELLWSRLTYFYGLSTSVFGNELSNEALAPLLAVKGTKKGWLYSCIPYLEDYITQIDNVESWKPVFVNETEFVLVNYLCNVDSISVAQFKELSNSSNEDVKNMLDHLINERIIYISKDGTIDLLTKACECMIHPQYGFLVADNYDGRFTHWLNSNR